MKQAQFYKKSADQAVDCELCNHFCQIKDGAVGSCGARKNRAGKLFSLVSGYPAAVNIDPIEKKPLFHFQPGSFTFSLGTLGCNFRCDNCQNWQISQALSPLTRGNKGGLHSAIPALPEEELVARAIRAGCRSIACTYNEPTIFTEYALDIMKLAKQSGLKNVWVSNGYMSESCLKAIIPCLDAANIDLKSFDEKFYQKHCGAKLKPVLENLLAIKKSGVHLEITTLVIPGLSSDLAMLKNLALFIANELGEETPWHVSGFSPEISWKLKNISATSEEEVLLAYEIGKQAGLKYVYTGNLHNSDKENTYCPKCGQLAIKRRGYDITRYDEAGYCPKCGQNLDIIA